MAELCENPGLFSGIVRFSLRHCGSGNHLDCIVRSVGRGRLGAVYKCSERTFVDEIFRLMKYQPCLIEDVATSHMASV